MQHSLLYTSLKKHLAIMVLAAFCLLLVGCQFTSSTKLEYKLEGEIISFHPSPMAFPFVFPAPDSVLSIRDFKEKGLQIVICPIRAGLVPLQTKPIDFDREVYIGLQSARMLIDGVEISDISTLILFPGELPSDGDISSLCGSITWAKGLGVGEHYVEFGYSDQQGIFKVIRWKFEISEN